jgi:hypothetical protein
MGFSLQDNEDLIAGLLRKQVDDLTGILRDVEQGRLIEECAYENLKNVEKQIRWLRKVWLEN